MIPESIKHAVVFGAGALGCWLGARLDVPTADYIAQHQFLQDLGAIIDQVANRTDDLRTVREQAQGLVNLADQADVADEDIDRVRAAAESMNGKLTEVEEDIQQTRSKSFYDPLDYPGKLAAELAFLYNTVAGGFGGAVNPRPTAQAVDRLEELRADVSGVMGRMQVIFDEDLAAFNELIRSLGMDPVVLRTEGARLIS